MAGAAQKERVDDSNKQRRFRKCAGHRLRTRRESARVIARDLIRGPPAEMRTFWFVDIYINKPGPAALTPTALIYKSTTRNSLVHVEAWITFAVIKPGLRKI
jgi:hypothetical protein